MQTRGVPLLDSTGQVLEWIGMCIDVTEQRLAEERIRRNEKLAVVGQLALSISHEINNPLAAVTNLVHLIGGDQGLSETTREYVEAADQELARVAQVFRQTLRFVDTSSRSGSTDLCAVVDSVLEVFLPRLKSAHISVERDYRTKAALQGHLYELQNLVANLLSNAHDAMRSGGRLKIRIREGSSWNIPRVKGLKLTIADTGTGIASNLKHKIFEPFFTTKEEIGAGLGLWATSEVIRKHNGQIALRSSTDPKHPGTVFSLFFPLQKLAPETLANDHGTSTQAISR
jgi:signal transduction histidine kinase